MGGNVIRLSGYTCPDCKAEGLSVIGGDELLDDPKKIACLELECEWETDVDEDLSVALAKLPTKE